MSDTPWDLGNTDIVLLGAGFSRSVTRNEAPLMTDFFSKLDDRKYWTLSKFLNECFDDCHSANIEEAMLKLDQLAASPLSGVDSFFDQCRKRHLEVRKELDRYVIERLNNLPIYWDDWGVNVLAAASERTTIITTNYDNIAERILSAKTGLRHRTPNTNCHHCKMCRILEVNCSCGPADWGPKNPTWRGSLLKLHGSVAWRRCLDPKCNKDACLIPDQHCRPYADEPCTCCGGECSPVLVPPSMVKTFDAFGELRRIWNAAYHALSEAESLAIWGFSFPPSDAVIGEMFRCSLGRSTKLKRIAIIDIDPTTPLARLQKLLSRSDREIHVSTFDVPRDASIPSWLAEPAVS